MAEDPPLLARRDFIRAHHPDRGGDAAVFIAGLAAFDAAPAPRRRVVVVPYTAWHQRWLNRARRGLPTWTTRYTLLSRRPPAHPWR